MRKLKLIDGTWRYRVYSYTVEDGWYERVGIDLVTPAGRKVSLSDEDVDQITHKPTEGWQVVVTPGALQRFIDANRERL